MTKWDEGCKRCKDCICWMKISDADGGIGVCDNIISDHNQHVIGHWHPACDQAMWEVWDEEGARA